MPSASKNKGSGFEREVAKFLTMQYGSTFIRAPGSGAYTGGSNSHRKQVLHEGQIRTFKGDIMPPEGYTLLNAEAKFYADLAFHQLFSSCQQIEGWLDQLIAASDPGDLNVLFMKFNRKGRYIAVTPDQEWLLDCCYLQYQSVKHGTWLIFELEKFFELNNTAFKKLCCNRKNSKVQVDNTDTHEHT